MDVLSRFFHWHEELLSNDVLRGARILVVLKPFALNLMALRKEIRETRTVYKRDAINKMP